MPPMSVQGVGGPKGPKASSGVDLLKGFLKSSSSELQTFRDDAAKLMRELASKANTPESRRALAVLDKGQLTGLEAPKKGWGK